MKPLTKLMISMFSIGVCFLAVIIGIKEESITIIVFSTIVGIFYICLAFTNYDKVKAAR